MDAFQMIDDILVRLIHEVWELEEQAIIVGEFRDITNNDMHIIEAIGLDGNITMSAVAKKLSITPGSLTTAMNGLVNKKYVERERGEVDRRTVYVHLTEKGQRAFVHHANFHHRMTTAVLSQLDESEVSVLLKSLQNLSTFFRQYKDVLED